MSRAALVDPKRVASNKLGRKEMCAASCATPTVAYNANMKEYITLAPEREAKAQRIHKEAIIIDGLTYMTAPEEDTYLKTLIDAGITATNITVPKVLDNFEQTVRRIADWYAVLTRFQDLFVQALTVDDIRRAKEEGKTAIIMGFQDTKPIENELKLIDIFYHLGVRIIQLTYQYQNFVGCGCGEENDPGLSGFGRDLVEKLNDLGILVDLSHCGPKTLMDAVEASSRPVACTHVSALTLCDHVRNKSDELIMAVAEKGGLIGLPSFSQFMDIRGTHSPSIIEYLDVVDYIVRLIGIDHVALGFDFEPSWVEQDYNKAARAYPEIYLDFSFKDAPLRGLGGIEDTINVTRGLVSRGYLEEDIKKVLGENYLRVFNETWN